MVDNPTDLVGKEFIFEYGIDRILPPSDKTGGVFATEQRAYRRERIVRCRDCKHAAELGHLCLMFAFNLGNGTVIPPDVEPNGFCAWGEPKKGGD